ncbi:hypothetical protein [Cupriavidus pinatubonensis]|uniref:hypothetical protein n=1 Tax=Cupriavidus pinatubonensis TaxID=248026 RepID=UPI001CC3B0CD|nr:hypothetical protein [Cupriavidus pinatubonensis]
MKAAVRLNAHPQALNRQSTLVVIRSWFPELHDPLAALPAGCALDAVLDDIGRTDFNTFHERALTSALVSRRAFCRPRCL